MHILLENLYGDPLRYIPKAMGGRVVFLFPSSVLVALETLTSFDRPLDIIFTDQSPKGLSRLEYHHWPAEAGAREQGTREAQKGSQSEWFKYRHLLLLTPSVLFV